MGYSRGIQGFQNQGPILRALATTLRYTEIKKGNKAL